MKISIDIPENTIGIIITALMDEKTHYTTGTKTIGTKELYEGATYQIHRDIDLMMEDDE